MSFKRLLAFTFFSISHFFCYGQDNLTPHLPGALQQLHLSPEDCYQELVVEKVLPYSKNQAVLVIPKIAEQEDGGMVFDSYILLIDIQTGKILQSYSEPSAWYSDALRLAEIIIDTAPYKVNASDRAFGIRVRYEGSSKPNPFSEETLSLFIPRGKQLVKVLDEFVVAAYGGEWDMNCAGEFEEKKKTLVISPKQTNSFYDLIVKTQITTTNRTSKGNDCIEKENKVTETQVLRFINGEYQ